MGIDIAEADRGAASALIIVGCSTLVDDLPLDLRAEPP
jgi:hypothetical protein